MKFDSCMRKCSIAATLLAAIAVAAGVAAAVLGAVPAGAVVLGEVGMLLCVTACTPLVWAAIQDGKVDDAAAA
jgi:hypothetical protein